MKLIEFTKMHGIGNDFVVVDALSGVWAHRSDLAIKLCDRRFGVGADGLIFVEQGDLAPYRMRMLNPDGSESEMCGNGLRCVVLWLAARDLMASTIETGGRVVTVNLQGDDVSVGMGQATVTDRPRQVQGHEGVLINVGNPHYVIACDDPWSIDLEVVGARLEHDPAFPDRANIHFITQSGPDEIIQRTWERGAGITLACGSGATAGARAAQFFGWCDRRTRVRLPGGDLVIEFDELGNATMTGTAEFAFTGRWAA
ncbi:MAG: diaminopimelate epimerase [Bacteroidetes bacterium]|nr:diaminopimelate epimerase [Bacteroidota bacterium]